MRNLRIMTLRCGDPNDLPTTIFREPLGSSSTATPRSPKSQPTPQASSGSNAQANSIDHGEKWQAFFSRPSRPTRQAPPPPPTSEMAVVAPAVPKMAPAPAPLVIAPTEQQKQPSLVLSSNSNSGSDATTPDAGRMSPQVVQQNPRDETPASAEFRFFDNEEVKPLTPEIRPVMPLLDASQLMGKAQNDSSAAESSTPSQQPTVLTATPWNDSPAAESSTPSQQPAVPLSGPNDPVATESASPASSVVSPSSVDYSERMHENASVAPHVTANPMGKTEKKPAKRRSRRRSSMFKMREEGTAPGSNESAWLQATPLRRSSTPSTPELQPRSAAEDQQQPTSTVVSPSSNSSSPSSSESSSNESEAQH
jgi:hypothetical protein